MFTGTNGSAAIDGNDERLARQRRADGYTWTTYPERLEAAGISWKVYQDLADNFSDNSLAGFRQYREPFYSGAAVAAVERGLATTLTGDYARRAAQRRARRRAAAGLLDRRPRGVLRAPEPRPASRAPGTSQQVLDALTANPEVWSEDRAVHHYDENDGYFDHVVPPHPPAVARIGGALAPRTPTRPFAGMTEQPSRPARYGLGRACR